MRDAKTLFKESWAFAKENYWKLLLLLLIPFVTQFLFGVINSAAEYLDNMFAYGLTVLITTVLMYIINFSVTVAAFRYIRGKYSNEGFTIKESFNFNWALILNFFVLTVFMILATIWGYILLIIPGIIISLLFGNAALYLILRDKKPLDSMAHSMFIVKGRLWRFFLKAVYPIIYWILLYICGAIALLIISVSAILIGPVSVVLMLVLGIAFLYFLVKIMAAYYVYFYKLFLEFETTAGEITEETLEKNKKLIKTFIWVGLAFIIVLAIVLGLLIG